MNDPTCRARDRQGHECRDKFGAPWRREGTSCHYEAVMRLEDVRKARHVALLDQWAAWVADLTDLEQVIAS